jgi:shikimate kinase/3-dehydroquinate synthase
MPDDLPPRIFLTGFSGTGKSIIAPLVAEALGWREVDTDALIREEAGRSITAIFEHEGEAEFRSREREAIERAAAQSNAVIAVGGGAIRSIENRRAMADGILVCLEASPQTILARLRAGDVPVEERPLLAGSDPLARIVELKSRRQKHYALADYVLDTERKTPQAVADDVVALARSAGPWFAQHPERLLLPEERETHTPAGPIWVEAPSRRYPVHVAWGALDRLGDLLRERGLSGAAWVISDDEVLPRHGDRALLSLREAGSQAEAFAVPAGEASKNLDVAASVYDWLVSRRAERGHAVVALGGGVVGDLAGFVAATYLRGLPFVQVPTSFLSMVDASIGGKVAVDHHSGKNLIGAFYQPWLVVEDVSLLKSLPHRMLAEGCAEAIKHALIRDPQLLDDMEAHADDLLHLEPAITVDTIRRNVAIKAAVVSEDERDAGLRAILNYGHTVGHAIEAAGGYAQVLHGAADAIGMTAVAEIGRRMGVTPDRVIKRQREVFARFGLPTKAPPGIDPKRVLEAISLDKKVAAGSVRWVLLEDIGRPVLRSDVPLDVVRDAVQGVLS